MVTGTTSIDPRGADAAMSYGALRDAITELHAKTVGAAAQRVLLVGEA